MQTVTTILTDAGPIAPSGPSESSQSGSSESQFGDVLNQELNSRQSSSNGKGQSPNSQSAADTENATNTQDESEAKVAGEKSSKDSESAQDIAQQDVQKQGASAVAAEKAVASKGAQWAGLPADGQETESLSGDTSELETPKGQANQKSSENSHSSQFAGVGKSASNASDAVDSQAAEESSDFLGMLKQAKQTNTKVQQNTDDSAGGLDQRAGMSTVKQKTLITQDGVIADANPTPPTKGASDNIMPVISPESDKESGAQILDFTVPNKIKQAMDAANAKNAEAEQGDDGVDNLVNLTDRTFTKVDGTVTQGSDAQDKTVQIIQKGAELSQGNQEAGDDLAPTPISPEIEDAELATEQMLAGQASTEGAKESLASDGKGAIKVDSGNVATAKTQADSEQIKETLLNDAIKANGQEPTKEPEATTAFINDAPQDKVSETKSNAAKAPETTEAALKAQQVNTETASQQQGQQGEQQKQDQSSEFAELLNQTDVSSSERPRQSGQDSSIAMSTQPASAAKVNTTQATNALNQPKTSAEIEAQINETIHTSKANFAVAAHERVMLMSNNGVNFADIRLDPADLGKMQIKMTQEGDQVNVSFIVQQPHAKEALENALPKLKELLAEQGIELGEGAISQESPKREMDNDAQSGSGGNGQYASQQELDADEEELDSMAATQIRVAGGSLGGIDYFA